MAEPDPTVALAESARTMRGRRDGAEKTAQSLTTELANAQTDWDTSKETFTDLITYMDTEHPHPSGDSWEVHLDD